MSNASWTDRIVGARMAVDQEFTPEVAQSQFSNPQWSLIMTATEFEIEQPTDPEQARLVANTDAVPQIIPELENVGVGAVPGGGTNERGRSETSSGLFGAIKSALGLGGEDEDKNAETLAAAEELTQAYAATLQEHLEAQGRWDEIREAAAEES